MSGGYYHLSRFHEYDALSPDDMVALDLAGRSAAGRFDPSSDTDAHRELYRVFPHIGGVWTLPVQTHSPKPTGFCKLLRPKKSPPGKAPAYSW
ncbi:MAG: class II aldolase/adducin family protein [Spirochaetaceae bacterium]|nr:class II aldolase/adducin family protein [Spirochaetaceae bacterium]